MQYAYVIFNAQLSRVNNQPQLTSQVRLVREGKVVFTGKETPISSANQADLKRLIAGGAIQLGNELVPGEYLLQWVDFEIVK
jgi:hypothetical protein